jgi:hypothetical protein
MEKQILKISKKKQKRIISIVVGVVLVAAIAIGIYLMSKQGGGAGQLTEQQIKDEIGKTFSGESRTALYPATKLIEVNKESSGWVAVGIKNLYIGQESSKKFSYEVVLSRLTGCTSGISKQTAESWVTAGRTGEDILISSEDFSVKKVFVTVPADAPECTVRYGVLVKAEGISYTNTFFDVKIKAK